MVIYNIIKSEMKKEKPKNYDIDDLFNDVGEMDKKIEIVENKMETAYKKYIKNNYVVFSVNIAQKYKEKTNEWKKEIKFAPEWQKFTIQKNYFNPNYNGLALLTGEINNIFVVDIDGEKGLESWNNLLNDVGINEPNTIKAKSGNGGLHIYFKLDEDTKKIKSGSNVLKKYENIDIRNTGGCIIVSPSNYYNENLKNNCKYKWVGESITDKEPLYMCDELKKVFLKVDEDKKIQKEEIKQEIKPKDKKEEKTQENNNDNINDGLNFIIETEEQKKCLIKILDHLKIETNNNYSSWLDIMISIFNITNGDISIARNWSKKSEKYDENEFSKKFKSFKKDVKNKLGMSRIFYYLKQDEPEKYTELITEFYKLYGKEYKERIDYNLDVIYDDGNEYEKTEINTRYLLKRDENEKLNFIKDEKDEQDKFNNIVLNCINNNIKLVVKSAYDTGKTTLIKKLIGHYEKILIISCRIALSNDNYGNFKKYGFKHYKKTQNILSDRLIIQYESTKKIVDACRKLGLEGIKKYDLIIIDESETTLNYVDAKIIKANNTEFKTFWHFLNTAKNCVFMDGDINNRTLNLVKKLSNNNFKYVVNKYSHDKILSINENVNEFKDELFENIEKKRKFGLVCMSETKAKHYQELFLEKNKDLKILLLTGKTGSKIKNDNTIKPNETWINYDIIITTNAVDIGVNFDVDNYFYAVYGVLCSFTTTPRNFFQMTARIRKPETNIIKILNDVNNFKYSENKYINFWTFKEVKKEIEKYIIDEYTNEIDENGKFIKENLKMYDEQYITNFIFNKTEELNAKPHYFIYYLKMLCDEKKIKFEYKKAINKEDKKQVCKKYLIDNIYEAQNINILDFDNLIKKEQRDDITEEERYKKDKFYFENNFLGFTEKQITEYNEQKIKIELDDNKKNKYVCYDKNNNKINEWTETEIKNEIDNLNDAEINIKNDEQQEYKEPTIFNNKALYLRIMYEKFYREQSKFNNLLNFIDDANHNKDTKENINNLIYTKEKNEIENTLLNILDITKKDIINSVELKNHVEKINNNIDKLSFFNDKFNKDTKEEDKKHSITKTLQEKFNKLCIHITRERQSKKQNGKVIKINKYYMHIDALTKTILINRLRFTTGGRAIADKGALLTPLKPFFNDVDIFDVFGIDQPKTPINTTSQPEQQEKQETTILKLREFTTEQDKKKNKKKK